jgi:hypothetical protein
MLPVCADAPGRTQELAPSAAIRNVFSSAPRTELVYLSVNRYLTASTLPWSSRAGWFLATVTGNSRLMPTSFGQESVWARPGTISVSVMQ